MAYTFNGINNLLEQSQGQGNNNIFNQGAGADQGGDAVSSGGGGSSSQAKTTTEGEIGFGGGSSGDQAQKPAAQPKVNSGQAILSKAKSTNLDTGFSKNLVQGVQKSQQDLENEANQYTQAQQGKAQQAVDRSQVEAAESGDAGGFQAINNVLRGPTARADEFNSGISSKYQDIDNLSTQGGLQGYLQKHGNETYNAGQSALDSLLLSRDKGYQGDIQQAKQDRSALQNRQNELQSGSLRNASQSYLDQKAQEAKSGVQGYLTQDQKALQDLLNNRVSQYNSNLDVQRREAPNEVKARQKQIIDELSQQNPDLKKYFAERDLGIDPMSYYKANNDKYDISNVAEQGEAQKYNRISDLLGQGGQSIGAKSKNLSGYDLNEGDLRDALMQAAEYQFVSNPFQDSTPVPGKWEARQKALEDLKNRSKTKRVNGIPVGITNQDFKDLSTNLQGARDATYGAGWAPVDMSMEKATSDAQKVAQGLPQNEATKDILSSSAAAKTAYDQGSNAIKKKKLKF